MRVGVLASSRLNEDTSYQSTLDQIGRIPVTVTIIRLAIDADGLYDSQMLNKAPVKEGM